MSRKTSPAKLASSAQKLNMEELEWLIQQLQEEIKLRKSAQKEPADFAWHEVYKKCGKLNCWCVNSDKGHGPYLYRSVRRRDKVSKLYAGRSGRKVKS